MYEVDHLDEVTELENVPKPSIGAPNTVLVASQHDVLIAYYTENSPEEFDGTSIRGVSLDKANQPVIIVHFENCYTHLFGLPNDEAFSGHPLYSRGLRPYRIYEIKNSSWLRNLEKINSVHPNHNKDWFMSEMQHYIFSFHDNTFECIAERFNIERLTGSLKTIIPYMGKFLM